MKIFMQTPFGNEYIHESHEISHMSYFDFLRERRNLIEVLKFGYSGSKLAAKLRNPEYIHRLYLEKNAEYMRYLHEFKDRYCDYDVVVMNPGVDLVHPEFLSKNFPNAVKCLPPLNKPLPIEIKNCNQFLRCEIELLEPKTILLALGTIAHNAILTALNLAKKNFKFIHGARYELPNNLILYDSYHCSRYNTQTKRLTTKMFNNVFLSINKEIGG